jgi:hypothetical protein
LKIKQIFKIPKSYPPFLKASQQKNQNKKTRIKFAFCVVWEIGLVMQANWERSNIIKLTTACDTIQAKEENAPYHKQQQQ